MALRILDPEGDIVIILQRPNNQNLGSSAIFPPPLKKGKKGKKKQSRRPPNFSFFDENPTPTDAVTEAIELPLEDICSLFELAVVRGTSPGAKSADAVAPAGQPAHHEVRFKVSSNHLRLASSVFGGILDGSLPERSLKEKIVVEDGSECRSLYTSEWDADVFLMLMNCIHVQHRKLPKKVELVKLAKFAILVDYYNCHESTTLIGANWIKALQNNLPTSHCQASMMWMFVSWVFADAGIFAKMTELAVKESKFPIEVPDLAFPTALIGMLGPSNNSCTGEVQC